MSGMIELTAYSGKCLGSIAKVLGWIMSGIYDIVLKISGGTINSVPSVSYTHLYVYQRQVVRLPRIMVITSSMLSNAMINPCKICARSSALFRSNLVRLVITSFW